MFGRCNSENTGRHGDSDGPSVFHYRDRFHGHAGLEQQSGKCICLRIYGRDEAQAAVSLPLRRDGYVDCHVHQSKLRRSPDGPCEKRPAADACYGCSVWRRSRYDPDSFRKESVHAFPQCGQCGIAGCVGPVSSLYGVFILGTRLSPLFPE